jgi:hypothetical protein
MPCDGGIVSDEARVGHAATLQQSGPETGTRSATALSQAASSQCSDPRPSEIKIGVCADATPTGKNIPDPRIRSGHPV